MMNYASKSIYLIAETAFSHEGSIDYLYKQIQAAKDGRADAVKFQIMLNPYESYVSKIVNGADTYSWKYTEDQWILVLKHARDLGLDIVVLPVDMDALDFCINNQNLIDMVEVHSINFNHKFMLEKIPLIENANIILGVGGRSLADIEYALLKLENQYMDNRIIFMYGFQSFPTDPEKICLGRVTQFSEFFDVLIGYADHTSCFDNDLPIIQLAYSNGCKIIEKHIVIEQGVERTDYQAAVSYDHFVKIREHLEWINEIQGDRKHIKLNEKEKTYRNREKRIIAKKEICIGDILDSSNIGYKVCDDDVIIQQRDIEYLIGSTARYNIKEEDVLRFDYE